jgi:hypothetical protein
MWLLRGATRTVLVTGRYAVKVPSLRAYSGGMRTRLWSLARGYLGNHSEAEWSGIGQWEGQPLCPVLQSWLWGLVQVYPRCQPLPLDKSGEYNGELGPLPKLNPDPGDGKLSNYGVLDGRIVRVDYDMAFNACPHDRSGFRNRRDEGPLS